MVKVNLTREFLMAVLEDRKKKNSQYSMRAFARNLGLSASQMSRILRGKKNISKETADKILPKLTPEEMTQFAVTVSMGGPNPECDREEVYKAVRTIGF